MGLTWFDNLLNPRKLRQGREGGGGVGERGVVGWVNGWMKRIGRVCGETDECCLREFEPLAAEAEAVRRIAVAPWWLAPVDWLETSVSVRILRNEAGMHRNAGQGHPADLAPGELNGL